MQTIAFFTPKMIIGGAEEYILTKSRWLVRQGCRVLVFSEGGENVVRLPAGCVHYTVSFAAPFSLPERTVDHRIVELSTILKQERVDLVEAHNIYPIYYAYRCNRMTGIPVIYNMLNELSHTFRFHNPINIVLSHLNRCGSYFTLTESMNCFVEKRLGRRFSPKIRPIPVERVPDIPVSDQDYVLTVCRFTEDKMYVLSLIEGFAEAYVARTINTGMTLRIVGDGVLRPQVDQAVREANEKCGCTCVILLGTQMKESLYALYAGCRLYVGMGTTILQAAQYGKPIAWAAFTAHERKYAWGFWGDREQDREKIAAFREAPERKSSYATMLACTTDGALLRSKGEQALELVRTTYDQERIMERWLIDYAEVESVACRFSWWGEWKMKMHQRLFRWLYMAYRWVKR